MSDTSVLVKTPIMQLDPDGDESSDATWLVTSRPTGTGTGRVTTRKRYPSAGTGVSVSDNGVVGVRIDNTSIQVNSNGTLSAVNPETITAVMSSKAVSNVVLTADSDISSTSMLPVEKDTGNDHVSCSDGYVTIDEGITWTKIHILATIESENYEDNMYIVPVVISANDSACTFQIDTTEPTTVIDHTITLFSPSKAQTSIKLYAYKDISDPDSESVPLKISYRVMYSGV